MEFQITPAGVAILKKELARLLPGIKSSHRAEAMARGLGFQYKMSLDAQFRKIPRNSSMLAKNAVDIVLNGKAFEDFLHGRGYLGSFEAVFNEATKFLARFPLKGLSAGSSLPPHCRVSIESSLDMSEKVDRYIHNSRAIQEDPERYIALMDIFPSFGEDRAKIEAWFHEQEAETARLENLVSRFAALPNDVALSALPLIFGGSED